MSTPRRLRDEDGPSGEMARMLRAGRPTRALPPEVRSRAAGHLAAVAATPIASSILLSWKGIAIASVLVLAATAGYVAHHATRSRSGSPVGTASPVVDARPVSQVAEAPVVVEVGASTPELPSEPLPLPSAIASGSPHTRALPRTADNSPQGDTLAREVALLEQARSLLDAKPAAALAVLDEHAKTTFPNGKLAIERELLALDTLERLGRRDEAARRAAQLLVRARATIYESRVRKHLASPDAH